MTDQRGTAKMAAGGVGNTWRRETLSRYADRVLTLHGRERLDYMNAHPISELLREHSEMQGWR